MATRPQADRQPWRRAERGRSAPELGNLFDFAPFGLGPDGPQGGRVFRRNNLPAHEDSTRQLAGLYPFQAGRGLGLSRVYIGQDRFTRGAFCFDPFEAYRRGLLSNPNIGIYGVIGSGKSSLLKTLALRLNAFNIRFFHPADTKGEMKPLAEAVGAVWWPLGPGFTSKALSPLYAPPKPNWMDEGEYRARVQQHRLLLLTALGETASGRSLNAMEELLLELALKDVIHASASLGRQRQPGLRDLVARMLDPTEDMARSVPIDLQELKREGRDLSLRFRSMVEGALKGVFDGDPVPIDLDAPGMVIDISRIRASNAGMALTMTCGQALADLTLSFSRDLWLKILDEAWMLIRYPAIVRRISEGQKLARGDNNTAGSATLIALHRISDLMGASPEVRELAMGLLADTSTRVIYHQAVDQIPATAEALGLTDVEAQLLPKLPVGTGLWKVGDNHSALVDHTVLRGGMEWPIINTDSRLTGEYLSVADPAAEMREELMSMPVELGA